MRLIVICGATATGKSGLALALAQRYGSIIISADSRQVYREFNIGTAKPTIAEQKLVPHYLIDICNPKDTMTVADYQQQAQRILGQRLEVKGQRLEVVPLVPPFSLRRRFANGFTTSLNGGRRPTRVGSPSPCPPIPQSPNPPIFLVGGTGLYIKSIVRGMKIPRVAPQTELRSQLLSMGQMQLYAMLQQVDSVATQKIHPHDSVRTLRALEVFYITGCPISELQGENPPDYPILQIGLDCDVTHLTNRIARRTESMVKDGFVEEVEYLSQKYGMDLPLLNTLGYQEIKQYLAGDISLDEAKQLTVLHTRQFAKRQRTWFRKDAQIEWFDTESPDLLDQVWLRIQKFITDDNLNNLTPVKS
ncbi:tRNA (adenosine(37)-N6)-dimethylallyltransferase MiaA [Rivularia sp. UHCC 0363]|uniref:tRNA (adenosine(37)-N6)-dimethylallyltransferase MiaA n=1 Tax=Rivularia sp. UHCC 0363 TaxID=3110244 RepID=UPI002B217FBC|nr:tRNA (adenosine(37)-N6)-dimethylallyltransferase MiaA [Rivularia sp. UHCC 0363]MEA5597497.1 tRNA (adenosine(37)-N6)-dimethylallyltransferase MiaA [Rivularia sp. UHCC 0363]